MTRLHTFQNNLLIQINNKKETFLCLRETPGTMRKFCRQKIISFVGRRTNISVNATLKLHFTRNPKWFLFGIGINIFMYTSTYMYCTYL